MKKNYNLKKGALLCLLSMSLMHISCSDSNEKSPSEIPELTDNIVVYEEDLFDDNYTFAIKNGGNLALLLDKTGKSVKSWEFSKNLGNDLQLLKEGKLLGIFKSNTPHISFGGYGGILQIINSNGTIDWEYEYSTENYIAHHDVEMLPNGNVLFIVWEKIDTATAQANGVDTDHPIYPEQLVEINPETNQIEWKWRSFDHIIQENNPNALNFGNVSENPNLIDINYDQTPNGDIMHANGIDYDSEKDLIYLSVNHYSEVWVIDHSTTTTEATTKQGGNYNKGGSLIYRFGNPTAYDNTLGSRIFYNNHFPNLIESNQPGHGNLMVFNNGNNNEQSSVIELSLPDNLNLTPSTNNEPMVIWSYTNSELYSGKISGAARLNNGNTLITEGFYGIWEVTPNGETAWKYDGLGTAFWRSYGYYKTDQEIIDLGIN